MRSTVSAVKKHLTLSQIPFQKCDNRLSLDEGFANTLSLSYKHEVPLELLRAWNDNIHQILHVKGGTPVSSCAMCFLNFFHQIEK